MSSFSIETDVCKSHNVAFSDVATQIRKLAGRASAAQAKVSTVMSCASATTVELALGAGAQSLLNEATHMDSLAGALNLILTAYENAEASARELPGSTTTVKVQTIEPIKSKSGIVAGPSYQIQEDSNTSRQVQDSLIPTLVFNSTQTSREQERMNDLQLQSMVYELLERTDFSEETWRASSVYERQKLLKKLAHEIADIFGISQRPLVSFLHLGKKIGGQGGRTFGFDLVFYNANILDDADYNSATRIMIHEMRHIYQKHVVMNPESYRVSAETVAQWKSNFKNYILAGIDGKEAYMQQPIEWDAYSFSKDSRVAGLNPAYSGSWAP